MSLASSLFHLWSLFGQRHGENSERGRRGPGARRFLFKDHRNVNNQRNETDKMQQMRHGEKRNNTLSRPSEAISWGEGRTRGCFLPRSGRWGSRLVETQGKLQQCTDAIGRAAAGEGVGAAPGEGVRGWVSHPCPRVP